MSDLDPAGIAAFIAAICGVSALSLTNPEHWGWRRIAMGACACASATLALLMSPSLLWWGAVLWGVHQTWVGWSFISRRRHFGRERLDYLQSSASLLASVALADSEMKPREIRIIRETYQRAGFSVDELREVDRIVEQCGRRYFADGSSVDRLYAPLRAACEGVQRHSNDQTRFALFRTAVLIAASDGFVTSAERDALKATAQWLGLSSPEETRAWQSIDGFGHESPRSPDERAQDSGGRAHEPVAPPDLATYYASVLGVAVTASPREVKRAYREKAKRYHPDVAMHEGVASARDAEERFKELSEAYDFFRGTVATSPPV